MAAILARIFAVANLGYLKKDLAVRGYLKVVKHLANAGSLNS